MTIEAVPGSRYHYSGGGYEIVEALVETLRDLVRDLLRAGLPRFLRRAARRIEGINRAS